MPRTHGQTKKASGRGAERRKQNKPKPNPLSSHWGKKKTSTPPQNFLWQRAALAPSARPIRAPRGRAAPPADTPPQGRGRGRHRARSAHCAATDPPFPALCPAKCAPTHSYPPLNRAQDFEQTLSPPVHPPRPKKEIQRKDAALAAAAISKRLKETRREIVGYWEQVCPLGNDSQGSAFPSRINEPGIVWKRRSPC